MTSSFTQLGVPQDICDALARRDIKSPFEIQAATIADALAGRDVCGRAPTGSGKTLAFGIPLVAMAERASARRPRALVLAPTRELADQIHVEIRSFSGKVRVGVVYGGVGYGPQLNSLRNGVEILVACPGRLEDLIERGDVSLADVDQVVLDEADRMADMGFMPAVRRLLDQTKTDRQTVLFSATLDGDVAKLTRDYQTDPVRHEVGEETPDITSASHAFWAVPREDRIAVTAEVVGAVWPAIIFCRTRHGADRLAKQLARTGLKAAAIHGGRSQGQRTRALGDFAAGRVHALVATDVAARGIHVDGVALVVHYDPPEDHKTYVHRSGRTARAGEGGVVVSMVQKEQKRDVVKMVRQLELDESVTEPDVDALRDLSTAPVRTLAPAAPAQPRSQSGRDRSGSGNSRRGKNTSRGRNNSRGKSNSGGNNDGRKRRSSTKSSTSGGPNRSNLNGAGSKRSNSNGAGSKRSNPSRSKSSRSSSKNSGPNRKERRAHLQASR